MNSTDRESDVVEVGVGPTLYGGVPHRLVGNATGGWVETWNGNAWVKPASGPGLVLDWFSGRPMTKAELVRFGILPPTLDTLKRTRQGPHGERGGDASGTPGAEARPLRERTPSTTHTASTSRRS